jgi:hypothetical protein
MVDGPLWPACPELDSDSSDSEDELSNPELGPSHARSIKPNDFAIDSESVIFWRKNLDSVVFSGVRSFDMCNFPEAGLG